MIAIPTHLDNVGYHHTGKTTRRCQLPSLLRQQRALPLLPLQLTPPNLHERFPEGKVVFLAPTKPLVAQQISACYDVMGVPESDTAELQGSVAPEKRRQLWDERRVFFCTPQSMANDIKQKRCDPGRFVCVAVDEVRGGAGRERGGGRVWVGGGTSVFLCHCAGRHNCGRRFVALVSKLPETSGCTSTKITVCTPE